MFFFIENPVTQSLNSHVDPSLDTTTNQGLIDPDNIFQDNIEENQTGKNESFKIILKIFY